MSHLKLLGGSFLPDIMSFFLFETLQWLPTVLGPKSDSLPWPSRTCMTWLRPFNNLLSYSPAVFRIPPSLSATFIISPLSVPETHQAFSSPWAFALAGISAGISLAGFSFSSYFEWLILILQVLLKITSSSQPSFPILSSVKPLRSLTSFCLFPYCITHCAL